MKESKDEFTNTTNLSVELTEKIIKEIEYYFRNPKIPNDFNIFVINSNLICNLIVFLCHTLFKPDTPIDEIYKYIDHIAKVSKDGLINFKEYCENA